MDGLSVAIAPEISPPLLHPFRSSAGEHVLVVPYTRIYDVAPQSGNSGITSAEVERLAEGLAAPIEDDVSLTLVPEPSPQSVSLNVSTSCNLTCGYCYAARGSFGGAQTQPMTWEIARAAIERLLAVADPSAPITIGFLGGEPFVNRPLLHRAVEYAVALGGHRRLDVRFSVTTNATLLTRADINLLRSHPFAVTVSLDGGQEVHDRQRPGEKGRGKSWKRSIDAISPLLSNPGRAKVAARATVTRYDLTIQERLETLSEIGFPETGFSPLRVGPAASGPLRDEDWSEYLAAMIAASRTELQRLRGGLPIRLTNLAIALKQLHRGAASPFPCGAGGGYFSVSAQGAWYACHRAIGDAEFELGTNAGIDAERRRAFLSRRHVHGQTDCAQCWARYLCSGGCHQEAAARSPASCDFIREWLSFCLAAYCELDVKAQPYIRPEYPTVSQEAWP